MRTGRRRALGQYFTPPDAAEFVLRAAAGCLGRPVRSLLDPACGDGSFLTASLRLGIAERASVHGVEIDPAAEKSCGEVRDRVIVGDALAGALPALSGGFDLVVGNPPFGGGGGRGRLETRVAARFVELGADGGAGGVILPFGVFANAASQRLRDGLLERMRPVAVVELPRDLFRSAGASARTFALVFVNRPPRAGDRCLMAVWPDGAEAGVRFANLLDALGGADIAGCRRVPVSDLVGNRWDPLYWCDDAADCLSRARVPLVPLGQHVTYITYGPIVTGKQREGVPPGDVTVIGLRELQPTGLDLCSATRVGRGSIYDPERCRVRHGDLLVARSGMGSLMKGRSAVYDLPGSATVGCFVDIVRLAQIDPGYVMVCLRSKVVHAQVRRIANGVGTPNMSFAEIKALRIPRLGAEAESRVAQLAAQARREHAEAIEAGRAPAEAARTLESTVELVDNLVFRGAS